MRRGPVRKILERVMAQDRARMLDANPNAAHPRIAIGISEVDVTANEHIVIIRAARQDDERRKNYNFSNSYERTTHPAVLIEIRKSKIENGSSWSSVAGHDLFVTVAGL